LALENAEITLSVYISLYNPSIIPSMSFRRSIRNASKLAAIKISQIATTEYSSDSDSSANSPISKTLPSPSSKPSSLRYIGTISTLRQYLYMSENTQDEEEKINLCTTIYETLVKDPTILIYEPKFREAVIEKMNNLDKFITIRRLNMNKSGFNTHTDELKNIIHSHIRAKKTRDAMLKNLKELQSLYNEYASWSRYDRFRSAIRALRATLENLKQYPEYVV